jgi:hypothetical protein
MKNLHLRIAAIVLFSSFAATSASFASTHDDALFENVANQTGDAAEMRLPLFSSAATASMCGMNEAAVEFAELVDPFDAQSIIDPDQPDAAVLHWLETEMQMSIDPTNTPQGIRPDYSCSRAPYNCPVNQACPLAGGASSFCTVTGCGMGECSACPVKTPGLIIKSWCSYGCMKQSTVVGGAFLLLTSWGWGPVCL